MVIDNQNKSVILYDKFNNVTEIISISPTLARLVAHIAADGYIGVYTQRRSAKELIEHPRINLIKKSFFIRYTNLDAFLVDQFKRDVKAEFNRKVVDRRKHEYEVKAKRIYAVFVKLGALKSNEWFVPVEILNSDNEVKREWLTALFDDEAYVSIEQRLITLNMVNRPGLLQVQELLMQFGIKATLRGPYRCRQYQSYHLCIYRDSIGNFSSQIGFNHPKKKDRLNKIVKYKWGR